MRLDGPQEADLINSIADHFEYWDLKLTLRKIDRSLKNISAETSMPEVAQRVVDYALMKEWLPDLVDVLVEARPGQQTFEDIKEHLEKTTPDDVGSAVPCHERYLLPGWLPFLDRERLRTIANHFNGPGPRMATVRGCRRRSQPEPREFALSAVARHALA